MDLKVMGVLALAIVILGSLFVFFNNQEAAGKETPAINTGLPAGQ
jgi:hypothetical protein